MSFQHRFPDDKFWLKSERLDIELNRRPLSSITHDGLPDDTLTFRRSSENLASEAVKSLENHKSSIKAYGNIAAFNQLGIKDYLLQRRDTDRHSRQNHSFGTALIGTAYFDALQPFIGDTIFAGLAAESRCLVLLDLALLLHDVGHLPFSHMMEEVFNDVNWIRTRGVSHRHDDAPLEQLDDSEKAGIKAALSDVLGTGIGEIEGFMQLLQDLIAGVSGVHFLDAIANSPIDADKIDYIFRDIEYTKSGARLRQREEWLADFLSNVSLSPSGMVRLNGEAAVCALELLEERQFLYQRLYLRPAIRAFEKIASTVVSSWLTSEVARTLPLADLDTIRSDLRAMKGQKAYELLIDHYYDSANEFQFLLSLCNDIAEDAHSHQDVEAREWFSQIRKRLERFVDDSSGKNVLSELSRDMLVEEPMYFARNEAGELRDIARDLHIDHPCGVLIDVVESPRFLASPRSRRFRGQGRERVGEQFLVPDRRPSAWSRPGVARIPLHECDFGNIEKRFAQVVVVNTMPDKVSGEYVFELFLKRAEAHGMTPIPSPWR